MAMELFSHRRRHNVVFLLLLALPSIAHPFVVPLTHRDSPSSPFFDPNASHADRWRSAHRRSLAHHGLLRPSNGYRVLGGEYHLTLKLGLPLPVNVEGFIDVAGPLIMTPCVGPLLRCRWPHGTLYDPLKSASQRVFDCDDIECAAVQSWCAGHGGDTCYVKYEPAGGFWTNGTWMRDVAVLSYDGPYLAHTELRFVCSNDDNLGTRTAGARIGMTGSYYGLVHQLGSKVNYRFSHCFARGAGNTNSHLRFNNSVEFKGLIMPLTLCTGFKYKYQVHYAPPPLVDLSVHSDRRLNIPAGTFRVSCNVVFDSLSSITFLPKPAYEIVVAAVGEWSKLPLAPTPPRRGDPDPWSLCFQGTEQDITSKNLPPVTLHFEHGVGLGLDVMNLYAQVDDNRVCLLMAATDDDRATIGTIAQQNIVIAYDLLGMRMAINPKPCTDQ